MAPPMELESVGLGVAPTGVSGREDESVLGTGGPEGSGGAGHPLKTSPGGSRAPGAAPWSLCLEALEAACHREK